eukprot:6200041-Pleurochrysis_carterae.AAC.1
MPHTRFCRSGCSLTLLTSSVSARHTFCLQLWSKDTASTLIGAICYRTRQRALALRRRVQLDLNNHRPQNVRGAISDARLTESCTQH